MCQFSRLGILGLSLLLAGSPAAAGEGTLRFGAGWVEPDGGLGGAGSSRFGLGVFEVFDVDTRYRLGADGAVIGFVAYEVSLRDRLGLEVALERWATDLGILAVHDVVVTHIQTGEELARFQDTKEHPGELSVYPLTLALHFHPLRGSRTDLFLGPVVGWVFAEDAEFDAPLGRRSVGVDGELAYGVQAGLDRPLGSGRWLFTASLRYLRAEVEPDLVPAVFPGKFFARDDEAPGALELDPVVARIGVGRRFGRG